MGATVSLVCTQCGVTFDKGASEVRRQKKRGREHFFCSRSCAACFGNKTVPRPRSTTHLDPGNLRDEFTPFRWFMARVRYRQGNKSRETSRPKTKTTLTLQHLLDLWVKQDGICPLTGWKMVLPENTSGWADSTQPKNASLDRIDCSKGYDPGNLRFVCLMANHARNKFTDEQVFAFCHAVTEHRLS